MTAIKNKTLPTLPPGFPDIDLPEINLPPGLTDYDKFGWFYKRNMSLLYDGLFNMFTGEDTLENLGGIDTWNNKNVTEFFDYPCNMLNGSAGELWPPNQEKDLIQFYSSDLCMSMKLFYEDEVEDANGVKGYRYSGTNETFTNYTVNPENDCFCVKGTCAPTGLLNAESCRMGSPAFISFPHFLYADPFLLDGVDGMDPDEELHSFHIDLVPELGTPMYVAARMQINMHVIPYKTRLPNMPGQIDILAKVPDVYLPLLWFEELAGLPEDLAGELKLLLFIMNTPVMDVIWGLMIGLGLLCIILSLLCHYGKIGCCCAS